MSKDIELAVIAADEAVRDSGLITKAIDEQKINVNPERMAINIGAGLISCDPCELRRRSRKVWQTANSIFENGAKKDSTW